jgi:predicted  nucleic acid-binding Zn-ribbon protein
MHQHKCSLCGTMWQHGEEWDKDMLAHECRACGCHQFRVFKPSGGQTAALPEAGRRTRIAVVRKRGEDTM